MVSQLDQALGLRRACHSIDVTCFKISSTGSVKEPAGALSKPFVASSLVKRACVRNCFAATALQQEPKCVLQFGGLETRTKACEPRQTR